MTDIVLIPDPNRTLTVLRNEAEAARDGTLVLDCPDIEMAELLDDAADEIERLREENERLRRLQHAFRNADAMDWSRLFGMLEDADDGAYSQFWLAVLTETKEALAYDAANTAAHTSDAETDKTD